MNATAPLRCEADCPDTRDTTDWNRPSRLASQWLAYSLLHLVTGPAISAHEQAASESNTPLAALASVVAETWEMRLVDNTTQPLLTMVFDAAPAQAAALAAQGAAFHGLQAAQAVASALASPALPQLHALPGAYLSCLKSSLEMGIAGHHSALLDQALSGLLPHVSSSFLVAQQLPDTAAQAWANGVQDGLIFALFHLLGTCAASSHPATQSYLATVAHEGMMLAAGRHSHAIAQYLIETREQVLEAMFHHSPALQELHGTLAAAGKSLPQALPEPLRTALALALPSERFLSKHGAADFLKELLTAVAVAIPVAAAGIHWLPRLIDCEGLAFAMLKSGAASVLIDLAGRSALPLGDFMSEKSWLAMEGAQQLASMLLPDPGIQVPRDHDPLPQASATLVGVADAAGPPAG